MVIFHKYGIYHGFWGKICIIGQQLSGGMQENFHVRPFTFI